MHPHLTAAQYDTMARLSREGAKITGILVHPYSGAATLYSTDDSNRRETHAIVEQDGTVSYLVRGH